MVDATLPHYGLPRLPELPCPEMKGPTPWSNWVIKGRVLAGAYPASLDDFETDRILTTLLELGVNTFVCLQAEFALHAPEASWRSGQALRPYIRNAQRLLIRARETHSARIKQDKLDFLHLPIVDGSVTSDTALSRLADDCNLRILKGERLYIHCWGGHGRTGTLVATMLGRLYNLSCSNALRYTQAFHDSRKYPQGVRSPQTHVQVAQVRRLLPDPPSLRGVVYPQPTMALSDEILRPASAASSYSSPSPLAGLLPVGMPATAADAEDLEAVSQQSPTQHHREAPRVAAVGQEALAAALGRTSIADPRETPAAAAARTAMAQHPLAAGSVSGTPGAAGRSSPAARAQAEAAASAKQRQAGYVEQFMRQRQMPEAAGAPGGSPGLTAANTGSAGAPAGKLEAKLGSNPGRMINMTASSGGAAGALGLPLDADCIEDEDVSAPLRPNSVTVTIPGKTGQGKQEQAMPSSGQIGARFW